MNFEFFFFLVYMSIVSFAIAFLAYGMVVRFMGKEGFDSRLGQIILVPACIIFYDFITIASGDYRYFVGAVPLAIIAFILIYYRFFKGESFLDDKPAPSEIAQLTREDKKFSKKSQRIHNARKNRGRE